MGFPDAELVLCELLEPIAPTYTSTPDFVPDPDDSTDPEAVRPPLIAVARTGGGTNTQGWQDVATVEVQCFGVTRPESQTLNTQVRDMLVARRGFRTQQGFVDRISETTSPTQIPYEGVDTRRVVSTWLVVSRKQ